MVERAVLAEVVERVAPFQNHGVDAERKATLLDELLESVNFRERPPGVVQARSAVTGDVGGRGPQGLFVLGLLSAASTGPFWKRADRTLKIGAPANCHPKQIV